MTWLRVDHVSTAMRAHTTHCRWCWDPVVFTRATNGKAMLVNLGPSDRGTVDVTATNGELHAEVVSGPHRDGLRAAKRPLYLPHFVTCPHADSWRKNR